MHPRPVSHDSEPSTHLDAEALFRSHGAFVAKFLARLGVNPQDRDDVLQEVFLVAHRRGGFIAGAASPTTWLGEIALRTVSSKRRNEARRRHEELNEERHTSGAPDAPQRAAEISEALRRVQRALDSLELEKRALFVLFEIEGEPCDAIASAMNVPIGTVYSRLHKARREFEAAHALLVAGENG